MWIMKSQKPLLVSGGGKFAAILEQKLENDN